MGLEVVLDKIEQEGYDELHKLAETVYNKYYTYYKDKDDLIQVGIIKAIEIIPNYNPKFQLRNYIYTGMRNEMRNYIYRNTRFFPVEDDILNINVSTYLSSLDIDLSIINNYLDKIDYIGFDRHKVLSSLCYLSLIDYKDSIYYDEEDSVICLVVKMIKDNFLV